MAAVNLIRMRRALSLAAVAGLLSTAGAEPPLDLGPEFQVNTFTTGVQSSPGAAVHEDGSFVIVWQSGSIPGAEPDGSVSGVFLQRYDANGAPVGVEQQANSFARFAQTNPAVGAQEDGEFVVVWETGCFDASYGQVCAPDGSAMSIAAQRFDADGAPIGGELIVNSFTAGFDVYPSVAAGPAGEFVVGWTSGSSDTYGRYYHGVFARPFAADGTPTADEFGVNVSLPGSHYLDGVAMDVAGNFVVVWTEYQEEPYGVYQSRVVARRFDRAGDALGDELTVTDPGVYVAGGTVAAAADGRFVVAWDQYVPNAPSADDEVRARRFAADGTPIGDELQVNTYTTGVQRRPAVASDAAGNFVVVWRAYGNLDGDDSGVFGRGFASDGAPLGTEFQVNVHTAGDQRFQTIAANAGGEFIVAWTSEGGYASSPPPSQDGSDAGIFARRLRLRACSASPECEDDNPCTVDTCENEVCLNRQQPGCCTSAVECSDGNGCTDDACVDNACPHTESPGCTPCVASADCAAPDACTVGLCVCAPSGCNERICAFEPIAGCCLSAADCEDGNACTQDSCSDSHRCVTTTLADCVPCAEDADCSTGCLVAPEVCDDGQCVYPEGCPTVEVDDNPLGAGSALLIRVIVPDSAPGQGKVKVVATATIGEAGSGETPTKRCTAGTRIGRARMTLEPDGDSNLVLELGNRGKRCLTADADGLMSFDVEVVVKRKKTPLATVVESRTWRQ